MHVEFHFIKECPPDVVVEGYKQIYRFVSHTSMIEPHIPAQWIRSPAEMWAVSDDGLEDPDAEFFIVYHEEYEERGRIITLCEYRERRFYAKRVNPFSKFSLPLVKKTYPMLLTGDLVNVQPLKSPAGLVYYLRYRYSEMKAK
jgi:hypothetical protein